MPQTAFSGTSEPLPITCMFGSSAANQYLELVMQANRVRVQPTKLGRRVLNSFWLMWLREIILDKTDKHHSYAIELHDHAVVISSSASEEGLRETVRMLAARIHPLPTHHLLRLNNGDGRSKNPFIWDIRTEEAEIVADSVLARLCRFLPSGAHLTLVQKNRNRSSWFSGYCIRGCALSGRELAMLVEFRFALACTGGMVKAQAEVARLTRQLP